MKPATITLLKILSYRFICLPLQIVKTFYYNVVYHHRLRVQLQIIICPLFDTMTDNLLEKIYLDDVLAKFSVVGRYHAVSILLVWSALVGETWSFYNFLFITEEVRYRLVISCRDYKFVIMLI